MKTVVNPKMIDTDYREFQIRNEYNLRIISFNVNGLQKRFIDVQHYMLRENVDIVCLQETRVEKSFNPRLSGYKIFTKTKDEGIQGLVTIVRNNIAATELDINFGPGTENQAFSITYRGNSF